MTAPQQAQPIVGIDIGGTFTDFAVLADGVFRVHKVLSTPDDPARAVLEGMRELGIPPRQAGAVVHGSTIGTNAVLERKGARTALVATAGFEDVLEIGRQDRPSLYDFDVTRPQPLAPRELRLGARERVDAHGTPIEPLTEAEARDVARRVLDTGAESVAVCLLFSFLNPEHERRIRQALAQAGFGPFVSLSSEVLPEYREYERTSTTVVNAYIAPVMHRYLARLGEELGPGLRIMQSSGGSVTAEGARARPVQTISGGPAGGVVGAFRVARMAGHAQVICLDMGGTSTDVSLCPGRVLETTAWELGGLPIHTPAIDVYSVGAGGGSIARIDAGGALLVGPESAGADPGPACYGKGDLPTVTDANFVLGRLAPEYLQGLTLDRRRAEKALEPLARRMAVAVVEAAEGVVRVANANMARAVRVISVERGHDPRDFTLVAFGGAGPLHACELAEALAIPRVLAPLYPGVLSAQGMLFADVAREYSTTVMLRPDSIGMDLAAADQALAGLLERGRQDMEAM
ncbi:MAG: hydantoinase/oxoprolinase family protein, partial [Dehalococcoidia bacterium]